MLHHGLRRGRSVRRLPGHDPESYERTGSTGCRKLYVRRHPVPPDQTTSGGQRLALWQPCWDIEPQTVNQTEPPPSRESPQSTKLAEVQEVACANVGPKERARSPFSHRKQIREVTPHRVGNRLAGVRVVFERVPGLTANGCGRMSPVIVRSGRPWGGPRSPRPTRR